MSIRTFNLPDVGEGLVEACVVSLLVEEGQAVARFDPLLDVETDKSTVELTSPWAGTVAKIHCAAGEYVEVGKPLIDIDVPR